MYIIYSIFHIYIANELIKYYKLYIYFLSSSNLAFPSSKFGLILIVN